MMEVMLENKTVNQKLKSSRTSIMTQKYVSEDNEAQ